MRPIRDCFIDRQHALSKAGPQVDLKHLPAENWSGVCV
jgi:hypothetical protein